MKLISIVFSLAYIHTASLSLALSYFNFFTVSLFQLFGSCCCCSFCMFFMQLIENNCEGQSMENEKCFVVVVVVLLEIVKIVYKELQNLIWFLLFNRNVLYCTRHMMMMMIKLPWMSLKSTAFNEIKSNWLPFNLGEGRLPVSKETFSLIFQKYKHKIYFSK